MAPKSITRPEVIRVMSSLDPRQSPPWREPHCFVERPCSQAFPGRYPNEWLIVFDGALVVTEIIKECGRAPRLVIYDGELTMVLDGGCAYF